MVVNLDNLHISLKNFPALFCAAHLLHCTHVMYIHKQLCILLPLQALRVLIVMVGLGGVQAKGLAKTLFSRGRDIFL